MDITEHVLYHRASLKQAKRIVVKAGSRLLVQQSGQLAEQQIKRLAGEISRLQNGGKEVVFVSSGAVAAGLDTLGMERRPKAVQDLQMAAAVGQICLMSTYNELFRVNHCRIGQVLLTHDTLTHRERHLNARNTLLNLIARRIVPIINENDAISTEEIKFGDNDVLAALVSVLVDADALVLLSASDGLCNGAERVPYLEEVNEAVFGLVSDKADGFSQGGMASKLESARTAAHNGIPVVIADGRKEDALARIFHGLDEGTLLFPQANRISRRKRWIAFFNRVEGRLAVDHGAAAALGRGKSLLPVGIRSVEGKFQAGAMVDIRSEEGRRIARGLVRYSSKEIQAFKGRKTDGEIGEIIHRNNMAMLYKEKSL